MTCRSLPSVLFVDGFWVSLSLAVEKRLVDSKYSSAHSRHRSGESSHDILWKASIWRLEIYYQKVIMRIYTPFWAVNPTCGSILLRIVEYRYEMNCLDWRVSEKEMKTLCSILLSEKKVFWNIQTNGKKSCFVQRQWRCYESSQRNRRRRMYKYLFQPQVAGEW